MALKIPHTVLALPIWAIYGFIVDMRTSGDRPLIVLIDIVDMHNQARACHTHFEGGADLMLGRDAVQPD